MSRTFDTSTFTPDQSLQVLAMTVVGGVGSVAGAVMARSISSGWPTSSELPNGTVGHQRDRPFDHLALAAGRPNRSLALGPRLECASLPLLYPSR